LCWAALLGCNSEPARGFSSLYSDAQSKFDNGDLRAALIAAEKGRIQSENTDPVWNWKFRILNADILLWEHREEEALSLVEPQPPAQAQSQELVIGRKLIQTRASYTLAHLKDAERYLSGVEGLASNDNQQLLANVALTKGTLLILEKSYAAAEQELMKARTLAEKAGNRLIQAEVFGTLGFLYARQGLYDKALDQQFLSLNLSQSLGARHVEAATRLNTGWPLLELGDFVQAIAFFEAAEKLGEQTGMGRTREESLNSLGRIYFNQRKYQAAADYFTRALKVAESLHDQHSVGLYSDNLALVLLSLNRLDEADAYNQKALNIQRDIKDREEELRSLRTSASIADARKEFAKGESILVAVLRDKDTPASVLWEAEDELATLYIAIARPDKAEGEFKRALAMLNASWGKIEEEEHKLAFSSWAVDFYTDYIGFLVSQGKHERALQVAESMRARTLEEALGTRKAADSGFVSLTGIHSYLAQQQEVVLAYWLAPEKSLLWIVTPSQLKLFFLPPEQQIEEKVEEYQKDVINLGNPLKDNPIGQELYRILIEPAQELIPRGMRVAVIPDGNLGKLNFETLIVLSGQPHYWIEDVELKDASSISLLMHTGHDYTRHHRLLAIGDPIEATPQYRRLVHAKDEMEAAGNGFSVTTKKVISGTAATPLSYTSNKPEGFDLIHFATHGSGSNTNPLDSAIILSPDPSGNFKLYARDIIKIPLKAEVVTISACYGAGERTYSGQGLVGLAWAFLHAGAHRVIAGLWNVDDDSTPQLMSSFYAALQSGNRPSEALREAKLKMLHSGTIYRLPYYWAALQLYAGS
jgi:CHAT domain-containing protein/Tfp pilus assembly protein PilF